jgi:hypothetical protein
MPCLACRVIFEDKCKFSNRRRQGEALLVRVEYAIQERPGVDRSTIHSLTFAHDTLTIAALYNASSPPPLSV